MGPIATPFPSTAVGKVMTSSDSLGTLDLDTLKRHLIHIDEEQICLHMKIQCRGAKTEVHIRFWSDDKFEAVNDRVNVHAGDEVKLFKDGKTIKNSATVGSIGLDDYEILGMDSNAKTKFFARWFCYLLVPSS